MPRTSRTSAASAITHEEDVDAAAAAAAAAGALERRQLDAENVSALSSSLDRGAFPHVLADARLSAHPTTFSKKLHWPSGSRSLRTSRPTVTTGSS